MINSNLSKNAITFFKKKMNNAYKTPLLWAKKCTFTNTHKFCMQFQRPQVIIPDLENAFTKLYVSDLSWLYRAKLHIHM